MNARDNTPLRAQIADRLAAGEDTAAGIAKAIGKGDTPSIIVKELNAMRTDGQVECEQRGKKKELVYWLAVPLDVAAGSVEPAPPLPPATISEVMLPPGVRHGTRAAQIYRVLPLYGAKPMTARQIATATGAALGLISPTLSGMVKAAQVSRVSSGVTEAYGYTRLPPAGSDSEGGETDVKAQTAEIPPAITPQIPPPQYDPNEVAFKKTGEVDVIRTLADARLRELVQAAEILAPCVPGVIDTSDMELQEIADRVVAGVADLTARLENKDEELLKQAAVIVDLRNQLEGLQREAMRGASCLSGQDRYTAAGYLVRASKRKPRTLLDKDKAREAALSSIRAGAQRAEVFALVPVGQARRGAEWRSA